MSETKTKDDEKSKGVAAVALPAGSYNVQELSSAVEAAGDDPAKAADAVEKCRRGDTTATHPGARPDQKVAKNKRGETVRFHDPKSEEAEKSAEEAEKRAESQAKQSEARAKATSAPSKKG